MPNLQKRRQHVSSIISLCSPLLCHRIPFHLLPTIFASGNSSSCLDQDSIFPSSPRSHSPSVSHHHSQNPSPPLPSHPKYSTPATNQKQYRDQNIPLSNQLRQLRMAIARKQLDRIRRHLIVSYPILSNPIQTQPILLVLVVSMLSIRPGPIQLIRSFSPRSPFPVLSFSCLQSSLDRMHLFQILGRPVSS